MDNKWVNNNLLRGVGYTFLYDVYERRHRDSVTAVSDGAYGGVRGRDVERLVSHLPLTRVV